MKMKILFVSASSIFNHQIKKTFESNGAEVFDFNDRMITFLPSFLSRSRLLWFFLRRAAFLKRINNKNWNKKLISYAAKIKPDFLFTTKGTIIYPQTLIEFKKMGIPMVNWFPENVYHLNYNNWFLKNFSYYDYFFTFDPSVVKKFSSSLGNLRYLPFGVEPDSYKINELSDKDREFFGCDVCFVGAQYPEREELLLAVKKMGINLKIFGWAGWLKSPLAENYHGPLGAEGITKAYSLAKISLNSNLKPPNGGANLKTFEIPAAGGFQISDDQPDLKNLFKIGEEIEVYKNKDELIDKIKFYLSNEEKRKQVALAGQKRVLKDHTLSQRIKEIFEITKT